MTCTGSGWYEIEEGLMPCQSCSPALAAVFADHHKLTRWLAGTATDKLVDQYELDMPDPCQPSDRVDPSDPIVHPKVGKQIAATAYQADCAHRGVEPNWEHFATVLGVGAPVSVPTETPQTAHTPTGDGWGEF